MIQRDKDGISLVDPANGRRVTVYDQPRFGELDAILDLQDNAVIDNNHLVDLYMTSLATAQTSIDAGHTAGAPQKPLKHVVDDSGAVTYVPYDPPLPDLKPEAVNAPNASGIVSAVTPPDKQAIMFSMVQAIFHKMFPDA